MKHFKSIFILIFMMSSTWLYGQEPQPFPVEEIDKKVQQFMENGDIPGLTLIALKGDQEYIKSYGYANIEKGIPVLLDTRFELASCSKAFTALAFLKFVKERDLSLDTPVNTLIPWFEVMFEEQEVTITLRQLLHHTSGIPWHTLSLIPESSKDDALEQTVRKLIGQELEFKPGSMYQYATINYDILALVMQKVTGESFEELMQDLFIELGLSNTRISASENDTLKAQGYKIGFFEPIAYSEPSFRGNNAAAYVISDANDLKKWMKIQLGMINTSLDSLVELTHNRDETVSPHNNKSYAMGWEVSLEGDGDILHSGQNPDFTAYAVLREKAGTALFLVANANSNFTAPLGQQIFDLINGEEIPEMYDPGDQNDTTYAMLAIALLFYVLVVLGFMISVFVDIFQKKRKFETLTIKRMLGFLLSLVVILPFTYGIYIFPEAILELDWNTTFIWSPMSLRVLLWVMVLAVGVSYLASVFTLLFPQKNEYKRFAPKILLLSILSGFANVGVIIVITSSIGSDVPVRYLLFYYFLILSIYLLGRRYVQIKLVRFTRGLVYELRVQLLSKILSTSYQRFEKINIGRIYAALNDDVSRVGDSTNVIVLLFSSTITVIGVFVYLISIAFWAALLTIFFMCLLLLVYNISVRKSNVFLDRARHETNIFMSYINDLVHGYKEISLHRNKKLEFRDDVSQSAERYKSKVLIADIKLLNSSYIGEFMLVALLGLVAYGIPEFFSNIENFVIMNFVIVLLYLIGPINRIVESIPSVLQIKIAWNRIQEFIKEIPYDTLLDQREEVKHTLIESFSAKGISFCYESDNTKESFSVGPIDLDVQAGEILFIIGGNGSGKTTLAKMLTGLYKPIEGEFSVNGNLVSSADLGEYFSTVFSPAHLFQKMYDIDLNGREEQFDHYLKLLQLDEKITVTDNNYSTIKLSSGQRKRLALLQCFMEDRPIYLFDEWAADQDPDYRKFFYKTLLPEMKKAGKIVIAITHDDNYFDVPDMVLKMETGKLKTYRVNKTPVDAI
ncbi:cyclic peptide export ABC transporter [Fulvivirga ulvae]|uniref:cyclic peptide export ABC transporter n=1 Tax=Fulvivirga ulvae TaxID=2904245 RepID=UPI001F17CB90|nr:cyclic peptide export ABC transporter [Fulvivirga ulvae]UII33615.1 cyclic peptide export ABC transporter [Fulvivirga ulvae]